MLSLLVHACSLQVLMTCLSQATNVHLVHCAFDFPFRPKGSVFVVP